MVDRRGFLGAIPAAAVALKGLFSGDWRPAAPEPKTPAAPTTPQAGDVWLNRLDGALYVRDITNRKWLVVNG